MTALLPIIPEQQNQMEAEYTPNFINMDCFRENETHQCIFDHQNNVNMTDYEHQTDIYRSSTDDDQVSKLTDLSLDIIREIFDYLSLGDDYYSFYQINHLLKTFIDNCFITLNLTSMSFRQFRFYYEHIPSSNIDHCQSIHSVILSNQIERFYPILDLYTNLNKLQLYSPNEVQLKILSSFVPNLSELHILFQNDASINNIKWLPSFKKLQICLIDCKINGMEIDQSTHSLSKSLSSLSITLSSTYDFYTLLYLLPTNTLRYLNISLYDNEFSYSKTSSSPISSGRKLNHFSFNMSLISMKDPSCLYDIIRFVSNKLRSVQTLTIICRLADGVLIDENKLRDYLSFIHSVTKYNLYIEMNNLPGFDQSAYTYPFWIDKGVNINIYRNKINQIKRVRIYTLPLVSEIINTPNYAEGTYSLIKSPSSESSIHQFILNDQIDCLDNDLTLIPNRICSSSNISLFSYLPRLSSFEVTKNDMKSFLTILSERKSYPNIRKLQLDHLPVVLLKEAQQVFNRFPCLQSLSIGKVDDFIIFHDILDKFLVMLPNRQALLHLSIGGLYFDDICPKYFNEKQLKATLEEISIPLCKRKNAYNISFDRHHRLVDIWL